MTDSHHSCPKCGTVIPQSGARGRPKTYCSTGCRRAAELEARRLQDRLVALEAEAMELRRDHSGLWDPVRGTPAQRAADVAQEIERAEQRLRLLLGGGE